MSKFINNAFWTSLRQVANLVLGFLTLSLISKGLGASGQGGYSLAILIPQMAYTFLNFGAPTALIYESKKPIEVFSRISWTTLIFLMAVGFLVTTLLLFIGRYEVPSVFGDLSDTELLLSIATIPLFFFSNYAHSLFQSRNRFSFFNSSLFVFQSTLFGFIGYQYVFNVSNFSVQHALWAYLFAQVAMAIISFWGWIKLNPGFPSLIRISAFKQSIKFGLYSHFSNIFSFINYRADILLLSYFWSLKFVGIYALAVSILEKLWTVPQSIATALFPNLVWTEDIKSNTSSMIRLTRFVLFLTGLLLFMLMLILYFLSDLLFGTEFHDITLVALILAPGVLLGAGSKILSQYLAGIGVPKKNFDIAIITAAVNVGLNLILIPKLHFWGAALATSAAYSADFFLKALASSKQGEVPLRQIIFTKTEDFSELKQVLIARFNRNS